MWHVVFGPVLFYDLLHTARRGRHLLFRVLYVSVLVGLLFLLYSEEVGKRGGTLWADWRIPQTQRQEVLRFNEAFFTRFTLVQFALIVLLTPGVTAGAIAEEKERRTLEFLLTTELSGYEIVLGKLVARIAYMLLLLLTGLPVLALLQLLGGVDPQLILGSFAASGITLLSFACLSIFNSVLASKPRTAIFATYVQLLGFFVATLLLVELSDPNAIPYPILWICRGNPYLALQELQKLFNAAAVVGPPMRAVLASYLLFHAAVAAMSLVASLVALRFWNRRQASQGSQRAFVVLRKRKRLPAVSDQPVLWKELYAAPFLHVRHGGRIVLTSLWFVGLLFVTLLLVAQVVFYCVTSDQTLIDYHAPGLTVNIRRLAVGIGCLSALAAAIHTAGAFTGERDRQTLDSLLTTPLTDWSIIWGKWWGGFLSVRRAWYCLIAILIVSVLTDQTDPRAVPIMAVACLVYAAFGASVGLWFSLVCRSTLRAMFWSLLVLILAGGGHQVLLWLIEPVATIREPRFGSIAYRHAAWFDKLDEFQTQGLTPPTALHYLVSSKYIFAPAVRDISIPAKPFDWAGRMMRILIDDCFLGIAIYALCAAFLLGGIFKRFSAATGRLPLPGTARRIRISNSSSNGPGAR
jgi:ABC-type transport system involved in multi-copper enzyme maturation permease subunit